MKSNDLSFPEVTALLTFAKMGAALAFARVLSIVSLAGFLSLGAYTAYASAGWQGAVVTGIAALVFIAALRAENAHARDDTGAPSDG